MRTIAEIKDQVAQKYKFIDWDHSREYDDMTAKLDEQMIDEVAKEYAQQLIEADRKDCAAKAKTKVITGLEYGDFGVPVVLGQIIDQDSILNRPLPKMI